jgi:peptidylprolyl isomerase
VTIIRNGPEANAFKADQAAFDALIRDKASAEVSASRAQRDRDIAQINTKYPNLTTTPSGLRYSITREGTGARPTAGKTVSVNYKGMLLSGKVFDGSDFHGKPLEFQAGMKKVIPGWDEAILDMKQGEKRLVVIPPELAYGERGAGNGAIPPNSFLVFEMELVKIR